MQIAIISDIHDNENQLLAALFSIEQTAAEALICLGDMHSTQSLRTLRENWDKALYLVLGNNDWPPQQYERLCQQWEGCEFHGDAGDITLAGRRIFFTHYPHYAYKAAELGRYDAAFYGHTHCAKIEHVGDCLLLNPGELEGRTGRYSWALYDSATNTVSIHPLP